MIRSLFEMITIFFAWLITSLLCESVVAQDVYPSEAWPDNAAVLTWNGTSDSETGLCWIAKGTNAYSEPPLQVQYDRLFGRMYDILQPMASGRCVAEGGLLYGVFPCDYSLDGTALHYSGATGQGASDDATTMVWLTNTETLATGAAYPSSVHLPLATIVTTNGAIVSIEDDRPWLSLNEDVTVDLTSDVTGVLPVTSGGTGASALTGVLKGSGTSAITAGTVSLASEVSGTLPVASGGTGATTLTGVLKGSGTSAITAGAVSLASEVSGTLPVANGGTGATTLTGVLKGSGTSAITAGTVSLTSETSGTLPVSRGGTGATTLSTTGVLKGNGSSAISAGLVDLTTEVTGVLPAENGGTGAGSMVIPFTFTYPSTSVTTLNNVYVCRVPSSVTSVTYVRFQLTGVPSDSVWVTLRAGGYTIVSGEITTSSDHLEIVSSYSISGSDMTVNISTVGTISEQLTIHLLMQ